MKKFHDNINRHILYFKNSTRRVKTRYVENEETKIAQKKKKL